MEGRSPLTERGWFRGLLCLIALAGTVLLGAYQRMTGPSWPVPVDAAVADRSVQGELPRSHGGAGGAPIELHAPDRDLEGSVLWRRYPTSDPWRRLALVREGERLVAELPHQPPAGKLEYSVRVGSGDHFRTFPEGEAAIIRFRGDVPAWILVPHILFMFVALTFVLRISLSLLLRERSPERFVPWVLLTMIPGGLVLGPLVQKHAFGAYWTGWPLGDDWTDNKTLIAVIGWLLAWWICKGLPGAAGRLRRAKLPAIGVAVLITLAIYLIPHSVHGSELDWSEVDAGHQPGAAGEAPPRSPPDG